MKITIIADVLGAPNNGTSLAAYNLINYLKQKGHELRVVCPDKDKAGLEGYYILSKFNFGPFNHYMERNGVVLAKADEKIIHYACEGADIVHCMVPFSASKCALKYCKEHNIPVTSGFHMQAENFTAHLKLGNGHLLNHTTYKFIWDTFYNKVNAIHYPTEFIKNYVKKYNKNNVPAYCISNGVQTKYFYYKRVEKPEQFKDKFVILMSGRLSNEKNQIALIKSIKYSKHNKEIQLYFAGDGPRKEFLVKKSKHLVNAPVFKLHKHEDLHDALWFADLCVHSSQVEIEAISVLEAFACGLVPVISNSPKSATSKFALMPESSYNYKSLKDLARKIDYWIEHPEEKEKAVKKYIEFSHQFAFDTCMNRMEQMLFEVKEKYERERQ